MKIHDLKIHIEEPSHFNGGTLDLCFSDLSVLLCTLSPKWFTDHFLMAIQIYSE